MVPADEGLGAHDAAVGQVDLRLQVDDELVVVERGAQLLHGAQPVARAAVRRGEVDVHAFPAGLGRVHGDVGTAQQLLHGGGGHRRGRRRRC